MRHLPSAHPTICTATKVVAAKSLNHNAHAAHAAHAADALQSKAAAAPLQHPPAHFTNPIVPAGYPAGAADPSVVFRDGCYHYCRSLCDGAVGVARAARLQDIGREKMVIVWRPEAGTAWSDQIWAPELQYIQGRWMIYFAASDGDNRNHRMYALQADTQDAQGSYTFKGKIAAPTDRWAIDGIAIENAGGLYFVWSGWRNDDDGFPQVIYIAPMSDACTISGERQEIAAPTQHWEQLGASLLEGPAVLYRAGRIFLSYSASASWTDDYALGLLTYCGGEILNAESWLRSEQPVFSQRPQKGVFGPGHNSFVQSPDGTEDWIIYHAIDRSGGGWLHRSVRAQRISWTADGMPEFGAPVACGARVTEPSGSPRLNPADETRLALIGAARNGPSRAQAPRVRRGKLAVNK